jgi:hypothetical protein
MIRYCSMSQPDVRYVTCVNFVHGQANYRTTEGHTTNCPPTGQSVVICYSPHVRLKFVHGSQCALGTFRSVASWTAPHPLDCALCAAAPSIFSIPRPLLGDLVHRRCEMFPPIWFLIAELSGKFLARSSPSLRSI